MEYQRFLISVTLFIFTMFATPGPNNATVMAVGLSRGVRATIPHCIAVALGMPCMLLMAGLGLGKAFDLYPILGEILKYVGSAYMLWMAWGISGLGGSAKAHKYEKKIMDATDAANNADKTERLKQPENHSRGPRPLTFPQAMVFQVLNPKGWLTCITSATIYAGTDEYFWVRLGIMAALMVFFGFVTVIMWAAGGVFMRRFLSSEGMRRCNYVFAGFLILSIALLFI